MRDPQASPRPSTLKRINMRRFLDEFRRLGPSTRAELTRATGVAPPTSSNIIADLLATGLLEATEDRTTAKGRPGKIFRLASSSKYSLGLIVGVRECVIAPAGLDGIPRIAEASYFENPGSYFPLLTAVEQHAQSLMARLPGECVGLGAGLPGLIEERSGVVAFSPNLHFMDRQAFGPDMQARLGIHVECTQEEHALCLAEWNVGKARGMSDFAVLDITEGMGMGVVSGGRYLTGHHGYAGEIGHATVEPDGVLCGCGNRGCLETIATDTSFLNAVRTRLGRNVIFEDIAREGIDVSMELERTISYVAIALSTIVNIFNPQAIFVHGLLFDLNPEVLPMAIEKVQQRSLAPSRRGLVIERAQGDKLYGALTGLLDHVFASVGPVLT